jgi:hypothetical protein
MAKLVSSLALTLWLALAPRPASATTVVRIGLEQMTSSSAVILHGVVTSARVETIGGNERHLHTLVDVRVDELLRGPDGTKTITLDLMGGRLGKWAMMIPGMPSFTAGEEVVLFLEKTEKNWALTGLAQGKYAVSANATGQKVVRRNLEGIHFMALDEKGRLQPVHGGLDEREQALGALLAEVRRLVGKK